MAWEEAPHEVAQVLLPTPGIFSCTLMPRSRATKLLFAAASITEPVYCILPWETLRKQRENRVYKRM